MKRKKVWRYYCEHCKKSGCSGGHIRSHEIHCTNNPTRICGMCKLARLDQLPIAELISALDSGDKKGVNNLRVLADGCPACMLAAIRQCNLLADDNNRNIDYLEYSFKKEREIFFSEHLYQESDYGV